MIVSKRFRRLACDTAYMLVSAAPSLHALPGESAVAGEKEDDEEDAEFLDGETKVDRAFFWTYRLDSLTIFSCQRRALRGLGAPF